MFGAKVTFTTHVYYDKTRERYNYVREFPAAVQAMTGKVFKRSWPKGIIPSEEMRLAADNAYHDRLNERVNAKITPADIPALADRLMNPATMLTMAEIEDLARLEELERLRKQVAALGGSVVIPEAKPAREKVEKATVSQALIDLKSHQRHKRGWRNERAEKKFDQARIRAAESLCAFAKTDDMGAIKTTKIQAWVDHLDTTTPATSSVPHDYVASVKALYAALKLKNRILDADGKAINPADNIVTPYKPESKARQPFEAALRILEDARRRETVVRWLHWIAAYTGMIESEIVEAPASEIKQINGVWVWYVGENRVLKSGFRSRVIPLHPDLIREGFLDYVKSREGKMLFEETAEQASNRVRKHVRKDLEIVGADQVFYSWRNNILRQIDDLGTKSRADYLAGHTPGTVRAKNYQKRIAESRHFRQKELPELVKVVAQFEVDAPGPSATA